MKFYFYPYLVITPCLLNSNAVPFVHINWMKIEVIIIISIDTISEMQESSSVQKDGRDSVSNLSKFTFSPIIFEGNNIGPTTPVTRNMGVDLQIKTDPELGTPGCNCTNLSVSPHISR